MIFKNRDLELDFVEDAILLDKTQKSHHKKHRLNQ